VHKLIIIAAVTVLGAATGAAANASTLTAGADVPRSWAPADSADSLWRKGRDAISDEDWRLAQRLFAQIHDRFPRSAYAADSYYWEAFALSRRGGTPNLRDAVILLERQIDKFASAASVKNGDSKSLLTRIQGTLARGGDANAAANISARAGAATAWASAGTRSSTRRSARTSASAGPASRKRWACCGRHGRPSASPTTAASGRSPR